MPSDSAERGRAVSAIIPCLDEEDAIGPCVAAVLAQGVGEVIVVDGLSSDRTAERAAAAGARVIVEPARGYGRAMLSGLAALAPSTSIVLFIDGDGSDRPEMIPAVLAPIEDGRADFVLGSRLRGEREPGSLGASQIVAGHLAGLLHPSALRRPLHGHVAVPGHPAGRIGSARHGGNQLRLEPGDADAGRRHRFACG